MRTAEPLPKVLPAGHLGDVLLDVALKVLCADPAWVQLGEEADEAEQVVLLAPGGRLGILRRDRVQQRPRTPSQNFDVGGAVIRGRLDGLCFLERPLCLSSP